MMIIKDKNNLISLIVVAFIVVTREDVSSSLLYPHHFMSLPGSIFVRVDPMEIVLFMGTGIFRLASVSQMIHGRPS